MMSSSIKSFIVGISVLVVLLALAFASVVLVLDVRSRLEAQPTATPIPVSTYHVTCYNYGVLIYEGDVTSMIFDITTDAHTGLDVKLPDESCVKVKNP